MKGLKRGIAFILALILMSAGSILVYADESKSVEAISFRNITQDELQNKKLSENGENKVAFFENGVTDFVIVTPEVCAKPLNEAVAVLQSILEEMTGAKLTIVNENQADGAKKYFCIDAVMNTQRPVDDINDGYQIIIENEKISICGADETGTRNGIYAFIEDILGCMFLTPNDTFVVQQENIYLDKMNEIKKPAVQWRDVYAYETIQNKWASKLKLNGIDIESEDPNLNIEELQYEGWGTWCHNCYTYLSPDDYFDEHPEYFSEKNGKRVTTYKGRDAYLCLSNPEVFEIVKASLAKKIEENPNQLYWDFSGNDNPFLAGCECSKCKALDKAAGGTGMGTLLPFLNKLAKAFPDKYISTLAYLHTLKAPENIKAEPNVVIKLCSMPGDQASSYLDGGNANAKQFKEQVEQWSKITDKIVVWDYVVDFSHLLMPFPNFAVQARNQEFYENHNIIGVFHQASREKGGEFACLRSYVLSRLMWEGSDMDVAECVSRYIAAYFGEAAPSIINYMNLCSSELYNSNHALGLYDGLMAHYDGYLSENNVEKYNQLIHEAKAAVAGDALRERRVEEVELSVLYAYVLQPKIDENERQSVLDRINELCEKFNITMVCEWESLESFNQAGLKNAVSGEKKELMKPYFIAAGAVAGIVLVAAAVTVVYRIVKKRKNKSFNKAD